MPSLGDFVFLGDPKLESRDEVHVLRFESFFCPKRDSCTVFTDEETEVLLRC